MNLFERMTRGGSEERDSLEKARREDPDLRAALAAREAAIDRQEAKQEEAAEARERLRQAPDPAVRADRQRNREKAARRRAEREAFVPGTDASAVATRSEEAAERVREEFADLEAAAERADEERKAAARDVREAEGEVARRLAPHVRAASRERAAAYEALITAGEPLLETFARRVLPAEAREKDLRQKLRGHLAKAGAGGGQKRRVRAYLNEGAALSEAARLGWLLTRVLNWTRRGGSPVGGLWEEAGVERLGRSMIDRRTNPTAALGPTLDALKKGRAPWNREI